MRGGFPGGGAMADAMEKARAARNVLERLGKKIPGVSGYLDRELTRELDQLVRSHLANSLDAARSAVQAYARTLDLGAAGRVERVGALEKDLDALANAVRHAGSGYTGLFDAMKVGQEQLERLYQLDLLLVADVEAVAAASAQLGVGDDGLDGLEKAAEQARRRFESREQAVRGVLA
jgi:hypothetical protein